MYNVAGRELENSLIGWIGLNVLAAVRDALGYIPFDDGGERHLELVSAVVTDGSRTSVTYYRTPCPVAPITRIKKNK